VNALIGLNRYLHDFTSAMWVCGSILLWLVWRTSRRQGVPTEAGEALAALGLRLWFLTLPALALSLATGGVRAATFARYEHPGEITSSLVAVLAAKHVAFAAFGAWAVWVHWKSRASPALARDSG
jgi:uncharacterized membrane protein